MDPGTCVHPGGLRCYGNAHGSYNICDMCKQLWKRIILRKGVEMWEEEDRAGAASSPASASSSTQPQPKRSQSRARPPTLVPPVGGCPRCGAKMRMQNAPDGTLSRVCSRTRDCAGRRPLEDVEPGSNLVIPAALISKVLKKTETFFEPEPRRRARVRSPSETEEFNMPDGEPSLEGWRDIEDPKDGQEPGRISDG